MRPRDPTARWRRRYRSRRRNKGCRRGQNQLSCAPGTRRHQVRFPSVQPVRAHDAEATSAAAASAPLPGCTAPCTAPFARPIRCSSTPSERLRANPVQPSARRAAMASALGCRRPTRLRRQRHKQMERQLPLQPFAGSHARPKLASRATVRGGALGRQPLQVEPVWQREVWQRGTAPGARRPRVLVRLRPSTEPVGIEAARQNNQSTKAMVNLVASRSKHGVAARQSSQPTGLMARLLAYRSVHRATTRRDHVSRRTASALRPGRQRARARRRRAGRHTGTERPAAKQKATMHLSKADPEAERHPEVA
mmetsp:Transcript_30657/g.101992  ORF Transcript_30657/g.101992 Transcript_30657/m.101992 type:complete len:308 (-) Transcript_30657:1560-2483(-)